MNYLFRERQLAGGQSPSLRLTPQPAPFDKGAKSTRKRSRRRGVRRDEGIPPYGCPSKLRSSGLVWRSPWFVGEGHGPPAGPCGSAGSLGTMRASSPTEVCYKARFVIFRLAMGPPWFVGEGFIPPAGVCAAAGSGGMRASRPTFARVVEAAPVGRAFAMVRRGGPNHPFKRPHHRNPFFAAACGRRSTLSKL